MKTLRGMLLRAHAATPDTKLVDPRFLGVAKPGRVQPFELMPDTGEGDCR
jgi:hypothetical protein